MIKSFFILSSIFFFSLSQLKASEKQNILMIVLDDLNVTAIKAMGSHPQANTPNLDRLIQEGTLFSNAHSNAPVCSPSRASFMTGVAPWTSGEWGFKNWLQNPILKNNLTMGEYAMKNGYLALQTGKVLHNRRDNMWSETGIHSEYGPNAYNGKKAVPHPDAPEGMLELGSLDATFTSLSNIPNVKAGKDTPGYKGWYNTKNGPSKGPFHYNNDDDRDLLTDEKSALWLKEKLNALENDKSDQPFFIGFGIIRPHTPLVVPQKYFDMFPIDSIKFPPIKENDREDVKTNRKFGLSRGQKTFHGLATKYDSAMEGLKYYTQAYLACVKFADDIVGQALEALENSPYRDNTTVVLFSDHGFGMGQKEELWKYTNWDEATHVPLIIRDPRFPKSHGKRIEHPVSLIDVFPTISDLAEWKGDHKRNKAGAPLAGKSLKPFLEDPNTDSHGLDAAVTITASWISQAPRKQNLSAVSKNYRYIRYGNGDEELYNIKKDPYEWNNIAANPEMSSVIKEHQTMIESQVSEKLHQATVPQNNQQNQSSKTSAEDWKTKYFGKHPDADANKDGELSWPEFHAHKKNSQK
jgi:arylsulfatase A-like enzyme